MDLQLSDDPTDLTKQFQVVEPQADLNSAIGLDYVEFSKPPPTLFQGPRSDVFIDEPESASDLKNPRYKTEICRNFKEKANCIYGDSCQFAHGGRELRDVVRNSKYKTKLCQKYWVAGYCAYGPRCNFLHDEDKQMTAFAVVEYGLLKKRDEVRSHVSKNRSPVSLIEMENFDSLDQMVGSYPGSRSLQSSAYFRPFPHLDLGGGLDSIWNSYPNQKNFSDDK